MKRYIKYIVIIAVIVAAIIALGHYKKSKNRPEWRVENPSQGPIREVVTATGSINPYIMVNVGTEVSGKLAKIYKDFNDRVRKGELLAMLDTEILKTNLDAAKGDLSKATSSMEEAKLDYDLLVALVKKDMTPEYDMKKAEFKYLQAKETVANSRLNLQRAQKNLDNAYITSPIDGVIVSREVDEGQTVAASMNSPTLFIIANNLDQMQITANVDEADIGKVKVGLPVEFTVDAHPTSRFEGSVQQIRLNPTTESNVVSYSVIIDATNPERKLLPGMTTNVTIVIQAKENVLRIPETATRFKPSKEVWELFGLKWDDELLNAGRKAIKAATEKAAAEQKNLVSTKKAGTPTAANSNAPGRGKPSTLPDRIKAKQARITPGSPPRTTSMQDFSSSQRRTRTSVVWVLEGNTPTPIPVKTGISDGAYVEVIEGLKDSATMVTGVNYKDAKQAANSQTVPAGPGMGRRF